MTATEPAKDVLLGSRARRRPRELATRIVAVVSIVAAGVGFGPDRIRGQVPTDTVAADTIPTDTMPRPDALPAALPAEPIPSDTIAAVIPADTAAADSIAAADTLEVERLPALTPPVPEGWETGVWAWDRDDLLASRATTLAELLGQVPGVIELRGGDLGMPRTATAFGAGGGGVRVFRDGIEVLPLEGSVPDLSRVGLAGVEEVRVERTGAGLRVELRSLRLEDPRPYSVIEAGTGDLDTNLLRGVFFHPRALGGNAGVSLERADTRGPKLQEPGSVTSVWLHYAYLDSDRFGVAADLSRSISNRDTLYVPSQATRTDWRLRGRWRPLDGVVTDLFWTRATLESDSTDRGLEPFPFRSEPRSQWGGRIGAEYGPFSGRMTYRELSGEGLPERELSGELVGRLPEVGGVGLSWERDSWSGRTTSSLIARGWTEPVWGLSLFGSWEDFERGVPALPPRPPDTEEDGTDEPALSSGAFAAGAGGSLQGDGGGGVQPPATEPRFMEGGSVRVGGRFAWRGLELSGARLHLERDSVHPLGLGMDRGGPSFGAGERSGWETAFRVPLLLADGLALEGSGQLWEEETGSWPYFPRRTWHGALTLHETYFPTGNLEVWFDLGVQGRDRMALTLSEEAEPEPSGDETGGLASAGTRWTETAVGSGGTAALQAPDPAVVPFYQSFYVRLQIRVVTVRIFASWENFTLRDENQDFPGRILPQTRAVYGVRWTLWN